MSYFLKNPGIIWVLLLEHLQMTSLTLFLSVLMAFPLALLIAHYRWLKIPVLGTLGVLYTIPSLAFIILLVPLFGLNAKSVIAAMVLYTQVILVRNLSVGLLSIEPDVLEAAKAMGMNGWQRWWQIQLPLILPIFLAGLRLSAIVAIAIASIGAKFSAGGLGKLLFDGIAQGRYDKIWVGTIAITILAFTINGILLLMQYTVDPMKQSSLKGRRSKN